MGAPQGDIRQAFARLEARLDRVEEAIDTNTSVFVDGIKMLEVQQQVAFRVLQDVFNGQVRVKDVTTDEDGIPRATVDVEGYIREHLAELTKQEERAKTEDTSGPEPILASVDDERPIEFGGDL